MRPAEAHVVEPGLGMKPGSADGGGSGRRTAVRPRPDTFDAYDVRVWIMPVRPPGVNRQPCPTWTPGLSGQLSRSSRRTADPEHRAHRFMRDTEVTGSAA